MQRSIFLILSLLVLQVTILATAQAPDKLIYNGKEYHLHSNPMEAFFEKNADKLPVPEIRSSALWRGYVATFEIDNDQLILKDIEQSFRKRSNDKDSLESEWRSVFKKIFPKKNRLEINWFSGLLVLPQGKIVDYVHSAYGSTYEKYTLISIKNGKFIEERNYDLKDYQDFRARQYAAFKKMQQYKDLAAKAKEKYDFDDVVTERYVNSIFTDYTLGFLVD